MHTIPHDCIIAHWKYDKKIYIPNGKRINDEMEKSELGKPKSKQHVQCSVLITKFSFLFLQRFSSSLCLSVNLFCCSIFLSKINILFVPFSIFILEMFLMTKTALRFCSLLISFFRSFFLFYSQQPQIIWKTRRIFWAFAQPHHRTVLSKCSMFVNSIMAHTPQFFRPAHRLYYTHTEY